MSFRMCVVVIERSLKSKVSQEWVPWVILLLSRVRLHFSSGFSEAWRVGACLLLECCHKIWTIFGSHDVSCWSC